MTMGEAAPILTPLAGLHEPVIRAPSEESEVAPKVIFDDSDAGRGGYTAYEPVPKEEQELLIKGYEKFVAQRAAELQTASERGAIFWSTVFARKYVEDPPQGMEEVVALGHKWLRRYYPNEDDVILDGVGYIVNPVGSCVQEWHLDYAKGYSSVFCPLTKVGFHNMTQYVKYGDNIPAEVLDAALKDMENVNVHLLEPYGYQVRQSVGPVFTAFKMNYNTIHRGISNGGTEARILFYVSVVKKEDAHLVPEEKSTAFAKKYGEPDTSSLEAKSA